MRGLLSSFTLQIHDCGKGLELDTVSQIHCAMNKLLLQFYSIVCACLRRAHVHVPYTVLIVFVEFCELQ